MKRNDNYADLIRGKMTVLELGTLDALQDVSQHGHVVLGTMSLAIDLRHKTTTRALVSSIRAFSR